jgi:hypothetical protein
MTGLESYNMLLSPEYQQKFGITSSYLQRVAPTDWLMKYMMGHMKEDTAIDTMSDDPDDKVIDLLLRQCSPNRDDDGNISWIDQIKTYLSSV